MKKSNFRLFLDNFKDPKYLLFSLGIGVIYFVAARFGLNLAGAIREVSLVWPATGLSIAALLIFGIHFWPSILLASLIANWTSGTTFQPSFFIAIGATLEALIAVRLLQIFGFRKDMGRVRDAMAFIIFAALIATAVSATIGTTSLIYNGVGSWSLFWHIWREWWVGDMVGALIVAPFILVRSNLPKYLKINIKSLFTSSVLTIVFIFICILIATPFISPELIRFPLQYLLLPTIILGSFLHKQYGSTWKMLILSAFSVWSVVMGWGDSGLLFVQIFLGILAAFFMIFSSLVAEHDEALASVGYSERKFKSLIEHSYDGVVLVDFLGNVVYASPSTERVLGWSADYITGKSGFNLIHPDDRKMMQDKLKEIMLQPGKVITTEYRSLHKDGKVHFMEGTGINLLNDPAVNAIVVNFRDITDRTRLDEAKSEFVSFTAHELRGPLSTIRWYMEVLMGIKEMQKPKIQEYLWAIYSANLKMTDTVNMLLNINRMEMGTLINKPEPTNVPNLIKQSVLTFDEEIKTKKLVIKELYEEMPYIKIDPNLATIIFSNFISNAVKYTPKSGKITIEASLRQNRLNFSVSDTGVGIPENQKSRIFTKSFRADNVKLIQSQGSGLGLYLTKSVIDQLGGKIGFESEEKKGSKFWVKIPLPNDSNTK